MIFKNVFSSFIAAEELEYNFDKLYNNSLTHISKFGYNKEQSWVYKNQKCVNGLFFTDVVNTIIKRMNVVAKDVFKLKDNHFITVQDAWLNVGYNDNNNRPHIHPYSTLSAVFYIRADNDSSDLEFINTNTIIQNMIPGEFVTDPNEYNSMMHNVNSRTGVLLIFPSWLMHYISVQQNSNDKDRVSLSVDGIIV